MAFVHGSNSSLSIDGTVVTTYCDQQSLDQIVDLAETTAFSNDDKTFIAGLKGATISIGGHWDTALDAVMYASIDGSSVLFDVSPDATLHYTGSCFITNYSFNVGVSDRDTWTANFTVTGVVGRA